MALYINPKTFCVEDRKKQAKLLEDQQIFDFFGWSEHGDRGNSDPSVESRSFTSNGDYTCSALGGGKLEKSDVKKDVSQEWFALASNRVGGSMNFNGGACGGRSGGHMSGHGRGVGDRDRLYCTHCGKNRHTHDTYWDLVGKNHNAFATPAEFGHLGY